MIELLFRRDDDNTPILQPGQFDEPFLPAVGDAVVLGNQTWIVRRRRFAFNAGAPNLQGVELYVAPS